MTKSIIIVILFLSLSATAQTYLQVGEKAPSLSGCKWILGKPVSEFEKGKTYVLVFGASWNATYLSRVPDLGAWAEEHRGELEMITVFVHEQIGMGTGPYGEKVEQFIKRSAKELNCSVTIDDVQATAQRAWLIDDMQQNALPLFVIVKDGIIGWKGNGLPELRQAVTRVQSNAWSQEEANRTARAEESKKVPYDYSKLYRVNHNGGAEDAFAFRSLIARYDGKIEAPLPECIMNLTGIIVDSLIHAGRLQMIGAPLMHLYYAAYGDTLRNHIIGRNVISGLYPDTLTNPHHRSSYGKWWHKPVLEVVDPSRFDFNWKSSANRFDYSLQVPAALGSATFMKQVMQRDLMNYFGYDVSVETRSMPYWKVTVGDKGKVRKLLISKRKDKAFTAESDGDVLHLRNAMARDVVTMLSYFYGYGPNDFGKLPPEEQGAFIDETGISEGIDFDLNMKWSFEEFRTYLSSKGLHITRSVKPMKVVVIRDPK